MSYIKRQWVIEHDWKCVYCQHVNRGRENLCFNCGKDIDEENAEIVPSDMSYENRVKDESVAKELSVGGPDWICKFCQHRERLENLFCTQCGGEQKDQLPPQQPKTEVDEIGPGVYAAKDSTSVIDAVLSIPKKKTTTTDNFDNGNDGGNRNFKFLLTALIVLGVVLLVWFLYWLFATHQTVARVQQTRWDYNVSLYERHIQNGHDWQGQMRSHYFNAACHTEVRSHHQCNPYQCNPHPVGYSCNCRTRCTTTESCHTSCRSTGRRGSVCSEVCSPHESCSTSCNTCYRTEFSTCWHSCPDYDNMCDYQYPSWDAVNHSTLSGLDHSPVRPNLVATSELSCSSDPEVLYQNNPNVNQCTTDEITFNVSFDAGDVGHYNIQPASLTEYNRYQTGSHWQAEYNHAGSFRPINPIQ